MAERPPSNARPIGLTLLGGVHRRSGALSLVAVALIPTMLIGVAYGYWTAQGTGAGGATANTLAKPTNVSASATPGSGTVPVNWTGITAPDGGLGDGFYVQRYQGATPSPACGSSPASLLAATSTTCDDPAVPDGTYTYRVTAVFGPWSAPSDASAPVTVINDATAPTVSSINLAGGSPTNAASVSWTVTFTENVTGVDAADFSLPASGLTGSRTITWVTPSSGPASVYTVTATTGTGTTGASGTLGLDLVDDDSIADPTGNKLGGTGAGNGNFTGQTYTIDKTAPTASSINRVGASPTNAGSVSWTVTFTENVTGVDAGDFSLAPSGLTGTPAITSVTPSSGPASVHTVSASTGTGTTGASGTLGLNLVDDDSIADGAGITLGGAGTDNGNLTGQTYTIDKTAPTVSSLALDDGGGSATPAKADKGDKVIVIFSEPLSVASMCSAWSGDSSNQTLMANNNVTVTITDNGANDTLTVSSATCTFNFGSVALGADYVTGGNVTFAGSAANKSTIDWTAATRKLTITLGAGGGAGTPATGVAPSNPTYTPSGAIQDSVGNTVSGTGTGTNEQF